NPRGRSFQTASAKTEFLACYAEYFYFGRIFSGFGSVIAGALAKRAATNEHTGEIKLKCN
ncbi:MAG: hypothetical protein ACFN1J_05930, partial [Bacteroidota bacterium]